MDPKVKLYNDRYQKIRLIGQGSGGKVYLFKLFASNAQQTLDKNPTNNENQDPNLNKDKLASTKEIGNNADPAKQKEYLVIKKYINKDNQVPSERQLPWLSSPAPSLSQLTSPLTSRLLPCSSAHAWTCPPYLDNASLSFFFWRERESSSVSTRQK